MDFIFPIPSFLRGKLLEYKRLYAFPVIPESKPFTLDSGAFALSKSGKRMDRQYLEKLHCYYIKYDGLKVAPDVFLDPIRTMHQWQRWRKDYSDCQVAPVIQCQSKKIEWPLLQYQLEFYLEYLSSIDVLFFSNPSLRAVQYPENLFQRIKDTYPVNYIHNLGAGWNIQDIQQYASLKGLDSIDSISYYNSTTTKSGNWASIQDDKTQTAIANAEYIQKYLS